MKDLSEFDDVLAKDIAVEKITVLEFEFENFTLRKERNHWEIFIDDAEEGEQGIIVEREDFVDGKFEFDVDGKIEYLMLDDFDRIDKFTYENEPVVLGMTQ